MSGNLKKKKYALNVFDIFIILLVVILIASVVYKISQTSAKEANQDNPVYTVSFECEEYQSLAKYLADGEAVYVKSTGELLGYIYKSGDVLGNTAITYVDENIAETSENSPLYDTARFEGKIKLNGNTVKGRDGAYYSIEELNISVGSVIEVYTDDTQFTITVKQIMDKDGE